MKRMEEAQTHDIDYRNNQNEKQGLDDKVRGRGMCLGIF